MPEVSKETYAIQPDNQLVAEVQRRLGLEGAQAQLWLGKVKHVTSVIFKELSEEWVEWRVRQYSYTPDFALMAYAEYTGEDLQDCDLVAEEYMRNQVNTSTASR